jgi:hypothetical protein
VPLSGGSVGPWAEPTRAALAPAPAAAVPAVRAAEVQHVEETGGKRAGQRGGLGAAATATVAALVRPARRWAAGRRARWGEGITGLLGIRTAIGHRLSAVGQSRWPIADKRDFQALGDRDHVGSALGEPLRRWTAGRLGWWHRLRQGTRSRRTFGRDAARRRAEVRAV